MELILIIIESNFLMEGLIWSASSNAVENFVWHITEYAVISLYDLESEKASG
jgi:hypothetical protein